MFAASSFSRRGAISVAIAVFSVGCGPTSASPATGAPPAQVGQLAHPIFLGQGATITRPVGAPTSTPRGAFYILEDSVAEGALVLDGLIHTDLDADTSLNPLEEPSRFDSSTLKPCVSGFIAEVNSTSLRSDLDGRRTFWGGGLGVSLAQAVESDFHLETWDAVAAGVTGFEFILSGEIVGGAYLLFKAVMENPATAKLDALHEDFCAIIQLEHPAGTYFRVGLDQLRHRCWSPERSALRLDKTKLLALHIQVVPREFTPYAVDSLCVEGLGTY